MGGSRIARLIVNFRSVLTGTADDMVSHAGASPGDTFPSRETGTRWQAERQPRHLRTNRHTTRLRHQRIRSHPKCSNPARRPRMLLEVVPRVPVAGSLGPRQQGRVLVVFGRPVAVLLG